MRRVHLNRNHRRWAAVLALGAASVLAASEAATAVDVTTPGPLVNLTISRDLNCDVTYDGDTWPAFADPEACSTFVAVGSAVYGSDLGVDTAVPWTPVSQTKTGTGNPGDPIEIVTTVTGGPLRVVEVDTYTIGDGFYRTNVEVTNSGPSPLGAVVYHAADCYLEDGGDGYSELDRTSGTTACREPDANGRHSDAGRVEQFIPLTPASTGFVAEYQEVWDAIGTGLPLPNTADPSNSLDNGMGLSWPVSLKPGETQEVSLLTNLSPDGAAPLTTTVTPDKTSVAVGDPVTMTVDVENPNLYKYSVPELKITLPAGTTYVPGSTSGADEPAIKDNVATFKNIVVAGDRTTFTFKVDTAGAKTGDTQIEVPIATATVGVPVMGTTADLTLTEPTPTPSPTATPADPASTADPTSAAPPLTPSPTDGASPTATPTRSAAPPLTPAAAPAMAKAGGPAPASVPSAARANRGGNALASTGASGVAPLIAAAALALLAGTALLVVRRRKSQH